jgi:hypothetical protein
VISISSFKIPAILMKHQSINVGSETFTGTVYKSFSSVNKQFVSDISETVPDSIIRGWCDGEVSSKAYTPPPHTYIYTLYICTYTSCRSRWPSGPRHVLSSFARKPGTRVRIPYKAWMFGVCMRLFCICVVLCLGSGLATGWSPVQGVLPSVKMISETEKSAL